MESTSTDYKGKCWKFPLYLLDAHPHWDNCLQRATEQYEPNVHTPRSLGVGGVSLSVPFKMKVSQVYVWVIPTQADHGGSLRAGQCLDVALRCIQGAVMMWVLCDKTFHWEPRHTLFFIPRREGTQDRAESSLVSQWVLWELLTGKRSRLIHSSKNDSKTAT